MRMHPSKTKIASFFFGIIIIFLCALRFVNDGTIDWPLTMSQSKNKTPILLLYTHECEVVERIFTNHANKKGITTQIVNIASPEDEPKIRSILQKAISSVS